MDNAALAEIIRNVSKTLDSSGLADALDAVAPLRAVITPDCHVGQGENMDGSEEGFRLQLEWYGGQLLSMVDNKQWHGINSWINLTEKFTTPKAD